MNPPPMDWRLDAEHKPKRKVPFKKILSAHFQLVTFEMADK